MTYTSKFLEFLEFHIWFLLFPPSYSVISYCFFLLSVHLSFAVANLFLYNFQFVIYYELKHQVIGTTYKEQLGLN